MATLAIDDLIWPLFQEEQIHDKVIEIVSGKKNTLLLSPWPQELDYIFEALQVAENRGAQIAMLHFGEPDRLVGATYHHPVEKTCWQKLLLLMLQPLCRIVFDIDCSFDGRRIDNAGSE